MAPNTAIRERKDSKQAGDPRDDAQNSAEVIDLATRNVLPAVSQRKRGDGFGLAAGILLVGALGAVTLWTMDSARNSDIAEPGTARQQPVTPQASAAPAPAPKTGPAPPQRIAVPAAPARSAVLARPPRSANSPLRAANPYASPTIVFDASVPAASSATVAAAPPAAGQGSSNSDFASRLGGVGGTAATAEASFDPATTITQGTLIPAVLETAIDTDVPGYVRAIVSDDVRSFDGARLLVPRSSRLIGQYKSGLSAGQKRAYVIWTRLIRPDGVSVNIGSPAIGFNGQTGLAGKVNNRFFQRFGSAMLLSVVGGLSSLGGNASVIIGGGGQSAAAAAIDQTGQIGPTIRVRQGEPIRVFTAKDLDFSKVS